MGVRDELDTGVYVGDKVTWHGASGFVVKVVFDGGDTQPADGRVLAARHAARIVAPDGFEFGAWVEDLRMVTDV